MQNVLTSLDWGNLLSDCSVEEKWAVFRDSLLAALNKFVPVRPVSPPGRPPWMTSGNEALKAD